MEESSLTPLFTIGVTVHKRRELLNETLASIIGQTFADFEVIVGNDYPDEPLTTEFLEVKDPRIRIVNHEQNLGDVENMNTLTRLARGRYVTWIADDDLYAPTFLQEMQATLRKFDFPLCAYSSFSIGSTIPDVKTAEGVLLPGPEFLRMFMAGTIKAIGIMGVFDRNYLNEIGGLEYIAGGPTSLYTEYLHLYRYGLVESVAYINAPLVVFRLHPGSWGCTITDVDLFREAGEILSRKSLVVLRRPELIKDFDHNLTWFLKKFMLEFIEIAKANPQPFNTPKLLKYLFFSRRYIDSLRGSKLYLRALRCLARVQASILWAACKRWVLSLAPAKLIARIAASARFRFGRLRALAHR